MAIESYFLWEKVSSMVDGLPGVYEKLCYDTPAFYVGKKLFVRLKEDGTTIVVYNNERDNWIAKDADVFFITDHYINYPLMLVNLQNVSATDLKELLINSWQLRAAKSLLHQYKS
ncbi:MAG: MmcQ/YjbR family DNA-binding protein [Ferruginibacter sp.]